MFMKNLNYFIRLNKLIYLLLFLIVIINIQSCVKDGDFELNKLAKNQYNGTFAAPFVNSHLTLKDILKDTAGIIQENVDHSLKLVYSTSNLYSLMAKDIMVIPDQSIKTDSTNIPIMVIPLGDSIIISLTKPYSFQLPQAGQKVDSIHIKSAKLSLGIETNINHVGKMELSIPNIRKINGDTLKINLQYNYPTPMPITNIDLSGYTIHFDNSSGHINELTFQYKQILYGDNNPNTGGYFIHLNDTIRNIQYGKLFGYIGQYSFNLADTTFFDIFNNNTIMDNLQLSNVNVGINYTNSYGVPLQIKVDKFQAYSATNTVAIHDFPSPNPIQLSYPKVTLNQVGQSIAGTIPLTQSTDLANAINIAPKFMVYNITGLTNPTGTAPEENFVLDTSKFTVGVNIEVPLEGKIGGFVIQDTLDLSLGNINEIDNVTFKVITTNAFPLSADVQVYFTDSNYVVKDSLITTGQRIIMSGIVDPVTKKVTSPTTKYSDIILDNPRVMHLLSAKKMIIRAKLTSYNYNLGQTVKIFKDNYIDVKLGVKAKLKANY